MNGTNDTPGAADADCGHSIEELQEYLETGESPASAHIDTCPECQSGLAALRRLRALTGDLISADVEEAEKEELPWLDGLMNNLRLETRAGRRIPLSTEDELDSLFITEGAVTALVRAVGDTMEGVLIGKCRIQGDVDAVGSEITLDIEIAAFFGYPLLPMAEELRREVRGVLALQTELLVGDINIRIVKIHEHEIQQGGSS